jgi:glycosyltransferase involved in cell wall biosynthesis
MKKSPEVSVVIPAYNEATYIDRLLEALSEQSFKDFEVIISDAESKDGTREVVESFKDKLDVKFIEAPPKGPAFGRNQGAMLARGDWLLFLDADVDLNDPNFIKKVLTQTEKNNWNTSSAKMTAHGKAAKQYAKLFAYQKLLTHTRRPVASGYCLFTRAYIFKENGGFNEKIHFGEDYEYVSRTGKNGKFGFVESTEYFVDPRRNEEHGLKLTWQGTLNEIYRLLFGYKKLEKQPIKYEFGKHKTRAKD